MCNSCSSCGLSPLASAIANLFGPPRLPQSGCGCSGSDTDFTNGFISGVNAANTANGCGCGTSDPYYAQQYALLPASSCGCSSGGTGGNVYASGGYNSGYYY